MPLLLILQSVDLSFLNKSSVEKNLIPQSYMSVTGIFAEKLSTNPADSALFAERINTALPKETYIELLTAVSDTFFTTLYKIRDPGPIEIDLEPLKARLKQEVPGIIENLPTCTAKESRQEGFRFCRPQHMPPGQNFEAFVAEVLDKELPPNYVLGNENVPKITEYAYIVILVKKYLPIIVAVVGCAILALIALFVFSPLFSILRWLGAAIISLTFLLAFFLISVVKLPELVPIFEGLSSAQIDLIKFFAGQVISKLILLTFFIGAGGILFFGSGIILKSHKSKHRKK